MALNPFFLQGSQSEQRLVQSLINEQLQIYGVDVIYLPRKILSKDEILTEVQSSTFNDNYAIEAYINTYEGYTGAGDIMTKFGFTQHPNEWWHFSYGDQLWAWKNKKENAIYGKI